MASPAFGVSWDPADSDYYVAARLADYILALLEQDDTQSELVAIFSVIEEALRRDRQQRDIIVAGFLEGLQRVVETAASQGRLEGLMGPTTRRHWRRLFDPPQR